MGHHLKLITLLFLLVLAGVSCKKWQDKPGEDPGLKTHYCNIPAAVNYNHGFPGIEDNSVCIFPSDPFVGTYRFLDTVIRPEIDTSYPAAITFRIVKITDSAFAFTDFCGSSGRQWTFTANRYYHAITDTVVGPGKQLMCRDADTLSGSLDYRTGDSSLYIIFNVISDTGFAIHQGTAYKQ
jgi:hypothetical protein